MSATGRSDVRIKDDRYMTPQPLCWVLLAKLLEDIELPRDRLRVLEPHAGSGAWVRTARRLMPAAHITANDVNDDVSRWYEFGADEARVGDFLRMRGDFDLVIGNPPYNGAEAHVRHAISLTSRPKAVVAFLLRLGFLESADRIEFWREFPPAVVYPLSERPSFTGGGTDQTAYAWFVWQRGADGTRLEVMSWKSGPAK